MILDNFNPTDTLKQLKDFQARSVQYVFNQLYKDGGVDRFLIADEAGLGKTWVAAGVVAKAIEHLHRKDKSLRIDVVYICSNLSIANQNISRLNVLNDNRFARPATRLTYLIIDNTASAANGTNQGLGRSFDDQINFISFTPGTTLDLKSRSGVADERAILYHLLKREVWNTNNFLKKLLKGPVRTMKRWNQILRDYKYAKFHTALADQFREEIKQDGDLMARLEELAHVYAAKRNHQQTWDEYGLIGTLRERLAKKCVDALEPDLIILDEFQRFRRLLDPNDPTAELAQEIFNVSQAKVLLLSATPYKMYTLSDSEEDDHYRDLYQTLDFLYRDKVALESVQKLIRQRRFLLQDGIDSEVLKENTTELQAELLKVMCRTERVPLTKSNDAMISPNVLKPAIEPPDVQSAFALERISKQVAAPESLEYWKSIPFPINYLKNYSIRRKMNQLEGDKGLMRTLRHAKPFMLAGDDIDQYKPLNIRHGQIRDFIKSIISNGFHKLLWVPPSMPYTTPAGPFKDMADFRKHLIFSAWDAVPDSIASTISYEVEREMVKGYPSAKHYGWKASRLLEFRKSSLYDRMAGMPVLTLVLPSPFLAEFVDPLQISIQLQNGEIPDLNHIREVAYEILEDEFNGLPDSDESGPEDQRWYWAAPYLLGDNSNIKNWCTNETYAREINQEKGKYFPEHVSELGTVLAKPSILGRKPNDLLEVVTDIALGSPATCALRSLNRIASNELFLDNEEAITAAAHVGWGFRSLFNQPQVIAFLQEQDEEVYWRKTIHYAIDGNIQSMLDEFSHILFETEGLHRKNDAERMAVLSAHIRKVLAGFETSRVTVDLFNPGHKHFNISSKQIRSRYAMRFGNLSEDESRVIRSDLVRDAFNSPFKPFILASTSIGQEGLDFHTYCHSVVHWNLPSNPVDLEQREGRVHRYKGLAIRKNVANDFGLRVLVESDAKDDVWIKLFKEAKQKVRDLGIHDTDIIPFWIYEGETDPVTIERSTIQLPYSREVSKTSDLLKKLAAYRVVFGQPRQEDLLKHILKRDFTDTEIRSFMISLEPPPIDSR